MLGSLQKQLAKGLSFVGIIALLSGCSLFISGEQLLYKDDYFSWASRYTRMRTLKPQPRATLQSEYLLFLRLVDQHRQSAEQNLDPVVAAKLTSFKSILEIVEGVEPKLKNLRQSNNWVEGFQGLAPNFTEYVTAKKQLSSKEYAKALTTLSKCKESLPEAIKLREEVIKSMLENYASNFNSLIEKGAYTQLAQSLSKFSKSLQDLELKVDNRSYVNAAYPNYGTYIAQLRKSSLEGIEKNAQHLSLTRAYCEAIDELKEAFLLFEDNSSENNRKRVENWISNYRTEGINWYTSLKNKAEDSANYELAVSHLLKVCCLNTNMNCKAEENRLRLAQYTKSIKDLYQAGKLSEAVSLLGKKPIYAVNVESVNNLQAQIYQDYGNKLIKEGDEYLESKGYKEARTSYELADKYVNAKFKIANCNDAEGRSFYLKAANLATANPPKCREAVEWIEKALKLVNDKTQANSLLTEYKACATKRLAVMIQADDPSFGSSNEKYALIDAALSNLKEDKYLEIVPSYQLPVMSRRESPLSSASKLGVDYVLVISLDNPDYRQTRDNLGKTFRYCTSTSSTSYAYKVYTYTPIDVNIYKDEANIRLNVRAYMLDVAAHAQRDVASKEVVVSWSKEYWYSSSKPEYIRNCPCCGVFNTTESTTFINNTGQFNQTRLFPSGMDLVRSALMTEVKKLTANFQNFTSTI